MAPPAWLPPLNSHENSVTNVLISEFENTDDFRTLQSINGDGVQRQFYIGLHVYVSYHSVYDIELKMNLPGLSVGSIKPVNVQNPELLIPSLREIILDEEIIPFQLEYFFYSEYNLRGDPSSWYQFSDQNQLFEKLANFVLLVDRKPENADTSVGVCVEVNRLVFVPDEEFRSWIDWYNEQKRVYPDFEEEYERAISVPRDLDEVLDEAVSLAARRSASSSIVRELESLVVHGDDEEGGGASDKSCSICLEEFRGGMRVTRLPCRHPFHKDCIARWLSGNHVCPLCRHPLPVES